MVDLQAVAVRSYIAEPDRGRRDWTETPEAQAPVYGNRRRVRGARGQRLLRRRGEYVERSFAHVYDTGGLRRTHLRGHQNILKRLLVHAGAFNLGLLMRQAFGRGTPRGLQGRRFVPSALDIAFGMLVARVWMAATRLWAVSRSLPHLRVTSWTPARAC
jgi:transposase